MDDWDDNVSNSNNFEDNESSGGKSFGKGRGFTPRGLDGDERRGRGGRGGGRGGDRRGGGGGRGGGGRYRNDDNGNGEWGGRRNRDEGNNDNNDDWGSGGGGRRNDRNNDDWNGGGRRNDKNNDDWNGGGGGGWGSENNDGDSRGGGRGRGRGRGGRDGDRGGRRGDDGGFGGDSGGFGNDNEEGGEEGEKRPPIYVPQEISEDEINSTQGVGVGINFKDYDSIKVNISGENPPNPIKTFQESGLRSIILDNLQYFKYDQPTPVQKHAIPIVMAKRDLMATAQTGSGKTAAFLLPIIHCLLENQEDLQSSSYCEPKALILSPTRELTTQIFTEARKFCKGSILKVAQIYGGTAVSYQAKLMEGAHILVATPGRLGDYLGKGKLVLSGIRFIVLDEADRMLDMGFKTEIEKFFSHETMSHQGDRQTLMFSATFDREVQKLAASFLNNYVFLAVGIVGGACKDVEQVFIQATKAEKKKKLEELLRSESNTKGTLLFVETKRNADFIASYLSDKDFPTTSIHGDRFQQQREEALRDFKLGRKDILVATSVAARGLDIKGVKHVINYDIPKSIDEYVHRIGRTGRLGNKGKATSFYDSGEDSQHASGLMTILEQAGQHVPEWLKQDAGGVGGGYNDSEFGGYDFRSSNNDNFKTGGSNQPAEIAASEEW